ncbi:hypothetical protein [Xanthovirga aplysinae]|uniref:hypothetical protein n=1 Tax=Xanthovirga aplysinae TaxID=2529853 RepID=UPI0012BC095D|nr:hypothetical protein [Xanthovirga aplysinae]MTI30929.1 hypothetical protein [Xanthovirga aplysinae]
MLPKINQFLNAEEWKEFKRFLNHPECIIGCQNSDDALRKKVIQSLHRKGFIQKVESKQGIVFYQLKMVGEIVESDELPMKSVS